MDDKIGVALQKLALSSHEFFTSPITEIEMQNATIPSVKGGILFIYKIFSGKKKLNPETYETTGFGDALFGEVPWGGGTATNPALHILYQAFGLSEARHIFQALSNHFDFFLTLDENSILKRYRENHMNIKAFCTNGKLKIINPEELVDVLGIK